MKHTPGPWLRDGVLVYALEHAGWKKGKEQFQNRFSATVYRGPECDLHEAEATARLMQYSPELLSLWKLFLENFVNGVEDTEHFATEAEALIAIIEGN